MTLPDGRTGRLLACGMALATLGAVWLGVIAPLASWYAAGAQRLAEQRQLAAHMASLVATLPALRRQVTAAATTGTATGHLLLSGDSDAVAGARLQENVQALAQGLGVTPSSVEMLPVTPAGAYRRIALRVSLAADWPVLIRLLQRIGRATPRMLIDDLQLHAVPHAAAAHDLPMEAQITILGFRAAARK